MAYETNKIFIMEFSIKKINKTFRNNVIFCRVIPKKILGYDAEIPKECDLIGSFANPFEGDTYKAEVFFTFDRQRGYKLKLNNHPELLLPHSKKELTRFLKKRIGKGVGEELLKRAIDSIGINIIGQVNEDPTILDNIEGMTSRKKEMFINVCKDSQIFEELFSFFIAEGLSAKLAAKIYNEYSIRSLAEIKRNPYFLYDNKDITFEEADKLSFKYNVFKWNDKERIVHVIKYMIEKNEERYGNTYISENRLKIMVKKDFFTRYKNGEYSLDAIDDHGNIAKKGFNDKDIDYAYSYLLGKKELIKSTVELNGNKLDIVIRKEVYEIEKSIVKLINDRINSDNPMTAPEKIINDYLDNMTDKASQLQKNAIKMAIRNRLSILTGGPGTGKTYTVNLIVKALEHLHKNPNIVLLAPTGRAAYRIKQVSGKNASTIHSALHLFNTEDSDINDDFILPADYVIVDESSMIDEKLFNVLLKRIDPNASILLVGDNDQLPSVSIGNILGDLIEAKIVQVTELNEVYRQAGESLIITNAHKIKSSDPKEIKTLKISYDKNSDFYFIDAISEDDCAEKIKDEYLRLVKYYGIEDVIIIAPVKATFAGVDNLNSTIQNAINPNLNNQYEYVSGRKILRKGDRVIHTKNNSSLKIVNGALGTITEIAYHEDLKRNIIEVLFDGDDEPVRYTNQDDIKELELGYCITIHKSQGSEIDHVIMPVIYEHEFMLRKRLIYTALTRAKKSICCIGNEQLLIDSCLKEGDKRYSLLLNMLKNKKS